jgi:hypothetical protein
MRAQEYKQHKFRYGVTKEVAHRLGISQAAATQCLRVGNIEALEVAIKVEQAMIKREERVKAQLAQ